MADLVARNADSRRRRAAVHIRRQADHVRLGVIMVGKLAFYLLYGDVLKPVRVQHAARGLSAGHAA